MLAVALVTGISSGAGSAELVKYTVKDDAIQASLTGSSGDAIRGRKVAINRKQGNCLACHKMPVPEQQFHGTVGTDLNDVGSRYTEGELRLRVVDSKQVNSDTIMPGFYSNAGLHRVMKKWRGKTILSPGQVEDVVAYLQTLREETTFAEAFGWAKKAKLKRFEWKNKVYTTEQR
jgi:sulfur-oxidizing protein SoxX